MRNREPGTYSSPVKSSKSHPLAIVTTSPRGPSRRTSSEIASETHVIASAREATSRATRWWIAALARVAIVSARRCAWATSESRRSAIHRAPVARCTAAPTRCVEPGGEVVITASIPCRRAMRIAAGTAVIAHIAFSSGTISRLACKRARTSARSIPSLASSTSFGLPPLGPIYRARCTHACVGVRSSSSRWIQRGSSGASTCVSKPSAGRYCASFNGRWTPPPPAGGK